MDGNLGQQVRRECAVQADRVITALAEDHQFRLIGEQQGRAEEIVDRNRAQHGLACQAVGVSNCIVAVRAEDAELAADDYGVLHLVDVLEVDLHHGAANVVEGAFRGCRTGHVRRVGQRRRRSADDEQGVAFHSATVDPDRHGDHIGLCRCRTLDVNHHHVPAASRIDLQATDGCESGDVHHDYPGHLIANCHVARGRLRHGVDVVQAVPTFDDQTAFRFQIRLVVHSALQVAGHKRDADAAGGNRRLQYPERAQRGELDLRQAIREHPIHAVRGGVVDAQRMIAPTRIHDQRIRTVNPVQRDEFDAHRVDPRAQTRDILIVAVGRIRRDGHRLDRRRTRQVQRVAAGRSAAKDRERARGIHRRLDVDIVVAFQAANFITLNIVAQQGDVGTKRRA